MKPLPFDSVPEDIQERFLHYKETRGFTPNSIQTMARRPNIVRALMQLNQAILYEGEVSEELKMLVSLIASQVAGCRYCQAHMANLSKIYKASEQKISQVWEFGVKRRFIETANPGDNADRRCRVCGGMEIRPRCHGALTFPDARIRSTGHTCEHQLSGTTVDTVAESMGIRRGLAPGL